MRKYGELGRSVEFSNSGVAGEVYDLNADDATRAELFRRATQAHAPRQGWYSLDYYAPNKGKDRWDKSAEGAPIFAVGGEGSRVETGTGGNYGFHSLVYSKDGQLLSKVGHGDDRYPGGGALTGSNSESPDPSVTPLDAETEVPEATATPEAPAAPDYSSMSKDQINAEYDKMRMAGDVFKAEEAGMAMHNAYFNK